MKHLDTVAFALRRITKDDDNTIYCPGNNKTRFIMARIQRMPSAS